MKWLQMQRYDITVIKSLYSLEDIWNSRENSELDGHRSGNHANKRLELFRNDITMCFFYVFFVHSDWY